VEREEVSMDSRARNDKMMGMNQRLLAQEWEETWLAELKSYRKNTTCLLMRSCFMVLIQRAFNSCRPTANPQCS
jgi:hypothetical protein